MIINKESTNKVNAVCVILNFQLNRLNAHLSLWHPRKNVHFFNFDFKWTAPVLPREIFSAENPGVLQSIIQEKNMRNGENIF